MRIAQIIDSLEAGGAEKMAVNYANALVNHDFSALVTTRKEGNLKRFVHPDVEYLYLERKKTLDFQAVFRLRKFCVKNKIEFLHAHSSSFLVAILVKFTLPGIKIIWHDHDGLSEFLKDRKAFELKVASFLFNGIISVNNQLKIWAQEKLNCKKVIYLPNFIQPESIQIMETNLHGNEGKRILCLANLRPQKNHSLLIDVTMKLQFSHPDWTLHLVGKDFSDDYSKDIKTAISEKELTNTVFVYDTKNDIGNIISQSDICILTSLTEGLPVSVLEYGYHKKPVVVTNVGELPMLIQNNKNGIIVKSKDTEAFYNALVQLIENDNLRQDLGDKLHDDIISGFSETAIISSFTTWLEKK